MKVKKISKRLNVFLLVLAILAASCLFSGFANPKTTAYAIEEVTHVVTIETGRAVDQDASGVGLRYSLNGSTASVSGYSVSGDIIIPAKITDGTNTWTVTGVQIMCAGYPSLTSVVIPDTVTNIMSGAFSGCTTLVTAEIGSGLQEIAPRLGGYLGDAVFTGCTGLKTLTIHSTVVLEVEANLSGGGAGNKIGLLSLGLGNFIGGQLYASEDRVGLLDDTNIAAIENIYVQPNLVKAYKNAVTYSLFRNCISAIGGVSTPSTGVYADVVIPTVVFVFVAVTLIAVYAKKHKWIA